MNRALLSAFNSIDRVLKRVLSPLVIMLSLLVAFGLVIGIVARELAGQPLLGLEEVILICVMWLYMLGATLASRDGTHLSGDFVQAMTDNQRIIDRMHMLASIISLVMAGCFVVWSYSLLAWGIEKGQSTPVFAIPLYVAQGSLFVCSLLFVFYCLRDVLRYLVRGSGGGT